MATGALTPDECWQLLMNLPRTSPLMAKLAADPEWVSDEPPGPLPWTDYTAEVQILADIYDLIPAMFGAQAKPWPRPVSAAVEVNRTAARAEFDRLNMILTGGR